MPKLLVTICLVLLPSVTLAAGQCYPGLTCALTLALTDTAEVHDYECTPQSPTCVHAYETICEPTRPGYVNRTTNQYVSSSCTAEPATCSNTVKDGDETGIDCGGSCLAACVDKCPTGYLPQSAFPDLAPVYLMGFYGGDPYPPGTYACVKVTQTSNPFGCDGSQSRIVSYKDTNGNYVTGCIETSVPVQAAETAPSTLIDAYVATLPPDQQEPANAPTSDFIEPTTTGAATSSTKTYPDGTICTFSEDASGVKTVSCTKPDGAASTLTETQFQTDANGCRNVTYANGDQCSICTVDGIQTIKCTNGTSQFSSAVKADDGSLSSAQFGAKLDFLGVAAKETSASLTTANNTLSSINSNTAGTSSKLDTTNQLLSGILAKDTSINVDTSGITSGIALSNDKLTDIETNTKNTYDILSKEKADNNDSVVGGLSSDRDAALNEAESVFLVGSDKIKTDFDPSVFPVTESLSNDVKNVFPSSQGCSEVSVAMGDHIFVIPCAPFVELKLLFGWVLYAWTVFAIWDLFLASSPKGN